MAPQKHIDPSIAFAMVVVGGMTDLLQFILSLFAIGVFLSPALDVFATIIFYMFPKSGTSTGVTGVLEFIPVFDMLPMWTGYAIAVIVKDRWAKQDLTQGPAAAPTQTKAEKIRVARAKGSKPSFGGSHIISG